MNNRDKIIEDIEYGILMARATSTTLIHLPVDKAEEIVELLREQEPRVITREELKQFEGSPCWFESSGTYMGKEGFWIIPATFHMFSAGITMSYTSVLDGVVGCSELGLSVYNKAWRCWTAKPTIEQREMVKWNE